MATTPIPIRLSDRNGNDQEVRALADKLGASLNWTINTLVREALDARKAPKTQGGES